MGARPAALESRWVDDDESEEEGWAAADDDAE